MNGLRLAKKEEDKKQMARRTTYKLMMRESQKSLMMCHRQNRETGDYMWKMSNIYCNLIFSGMYEMFRVQSCGGAVCIINSY